MKLWYNYCNFMPCDKSTIIIKNKKDKNMVLDNLYLIVAITEKSNAIGKNNDLLYFLKEDMNFFKEKTCGNSVICGRKTFDGFKIKPLPKRNNIVLTTSDFSFEGVRVFNNIEDLIEFVKENPDEKFFVCGGMSIYKQLIGYCSKMYITKYEEKEIIEADSHFPEIDEKLWKVAEKVEGKNENPKLTFYTYERI